MTEKRFTIHFDKRVIVDAKKNAEYGFLVELKTILNELNDEKEQLKQQLQDIQEYIDNTINKNEEAMEQGKKNGADIGSIGFYTHMLKKMRKDWFE